MKHKRELVIFILIAIISLCSCKNNSFIQSNSLDLITTEKMFESTTAAIAIDEIDNTYTKHIKKSVNEFFSVDADIIIPNGFSGHVNEYLFKLKRYEKETVFDAFDLYSEEIEQTANNAFSGRDVYINLGMGLIFCTEKGKGYSELTIWPDICKKEEELSFKPREIVEKEVLSFLNDNLKIENELEILNSYVFDNDTELAYNDIWGGIEDLKTGEIVESYNIIDGIEGGYYFEIAEKIDGIMFNTTNYEKNGINYPGFLARCIYTEKGIEYLFIDDEVVKEDIVTEVTIIPPSQVIECVNNKLKNIILSETYILNEMRLKYYPMDQGILRIAWEVNLYDGRNDFKIWFDAETGKEIVIN